MKTYLVTGGAGFIGSHLTRALLERGAAVRVLDDLSTGRLENLEAVRDGIEFIEGDLNDDEPVRRAVAGVDCAFHEAALGSVPRSVEDPRATHRACVSGTVNLLHHAREAGVRRVVYAGSSSCYGDQPVSSKRESDPSAPLSPYAAAKLSGELYCQAFSRVYPLETVCLRYFNVFGPRQDPAGAYAAVIPRFIASMLQGQPPVIYGDGQQSRDFTYVDNVVRGNLLACDQPAAAGETLNIASGRAVSLLTLVHLLNQLLGTRIEPRFEPPRAGDVQHSLADISKAHEVLGYWPEVAFREGLERTVRSFGDGC